MATTHVWAGLGSIVSPGGQSWGEGRCARRWTTTVVLSSGETRGSVASQVRSAGSQEPRMPLGQDQPRDSTVPDYSGDKDSNPL